MVRELRNFCNSAFSVEIGVGKRLVAVGQVFGPESQPLSGPAIPRMPSDWPLQL